MNTHVYPNEHIFQGHQSSAEKWSVHPLMEELKVALHKIVIFIHFSSQSEPSSFSGFVESVSTLRDRLVWLLWGGAYQPRVCTPV